MKPMNRYSGFTLIELMVVLAISAILVTLAAPSFTRTVQSTKVTSAVNTFMADARFARSEAVRQGGIVTMCFRDAVDNATGPVCGTDATKGWANGWVIFRDVNGNGVRNFNADESLNDTILRVQDPITSLEAIPDTSGTVTKLKFTGTGRLLNANSTATLTFGGSYALDIQRQVCISLGGRVRVGGDHVGGDGVPCP